MSGAAPLRSGLRTLILTDFAPRLLRGVILPQGEMRWPQKSSNETLDYCLDLTDWLADCGDTLASFAVTVTPSGGTYDLGTVWTLQDSGRALVAVSGGVPDSLYTILIVAKTTGNRRVAASIGLWINTDTPATAPDAPANPPGTMTTETGIPVETETGQVGVANAPMP